jgi:hypothetical protein
MNTKFYARKPKKIIHPPTPGVRSLCAALLMTPVLLGACLALQKSTPFKFRLTLLKFVEDKKIPPARFSRATLPISISAHVKQSTIR